jgi:hypothetical protein
MDLRPLKIIQHQLILPTETTDFYLFNSLLGIHESELATAGGGARYREWFIKSTWSSRRPAVV